MIQFNLNPVYNPQNIFSVQGAVSQLSSFATAFHQTWGILEAGGTLLNGTAFDPGTLADWSRNYRDGVINVGGRPTDTAFFTDMMGGTPKSTKGTDLTIKYNNYTDFNVTAAADGTYVPAPSSLAGARFGNSTSTTYTGPYVSFQIAQSNYSLNGQTANIAVGNILYYHDDGQQLQVIKIDTTTDFAWIIYAAPLDSSYVVNIQGGRKLLPMQINMTSGYSDANIVQAGSIWKTEGYFKIIQPFQFEQAWEVPYELEMPYQDVMQFPVLFSPFTGEKIDTFDFLAAQNARRINDMSKNVQMFVGGNINNTYLSGAFYTQKYNGFDSLMNSIWYGGGNVRPYDNTYGFDIDTDYTQVILESDALKQATEYLFLVSKSFKMSMLRNAQDMYKNNSGGMTFASFSRSGSDMGDIKRYGIDSYNWLGSTVHIKEVGAFSDKRFMGQGPIRNMGLLMPTYGLTDSNGQPVNPIEMWLPEGRALSGAYSEIFRDDYLSDNRQRRYSGNVTEQIMMSVNGVENMYAYMPTVNAAN